MKTFAALAAGLALFALAQPARAEAPPSSLTPSVSLVQPAGCCSADTHVPLMLKLRLRYRPLPAVESAAVEDGKLRIRLLAPDAWESVAPYDAWLPVDAAPVRQAQVLPVEILMLDTPGDAEPETIDIGSGVRLVFTEPFVHVLAIDPPQPTSEDEIRLIVDHRPLYGTTLVPSVGHRRRVLSNYGPWAATPEGAPISIGHLPAGRHRIELVSGNARVDVDLVVKEPAPAPEERAILAGGFEVEATWATAAGESGTARLVQPPSRDSALFYFFSRDNWELMVKVLDACAINGHYWVFGAASTDAGYRIEVRRPATGQLFSVDNPIGRSAPAITETRAFPCD